MRFADLTITNIDGLAQSPGYGQEQITLSDGSQVLAPHTYLASDGQQRRSILKIVASVPFQQLDPRDQADLEEIAAHLRACRKETQHLVWLLDVLSDRGYRAFKFAYAPGITLADMLSRTQGQGLTVERALRAMAEIARGLETLHRRGLAHLDVKTDNIFVAAREPRAFMRLGDLGCVRIIRSGQRPSTSLLAGLPAMSMPFAAPEQLRDPIMGCGTAADIWACGVILYEMLTGARPYSVVCDPYDRQTKAAWLQAACHCLLPMPPTIPQSVQDIVRSCLRVPVGQRIPDAGALLARVERALRQLTETTPATVPAAPSLPTGQPADAVAAARPAPEKRPRPAAARPSRPTPRREAFEEYAPYASRVRELREAVEAARGTTRPAQAQDEQRKAVAAALYQLAQVYGDGLEYQAAVRTYEETLRWSPQHPFAKSKLEMLRTYGPPADRTLSCAQCRTATFTMTVGEQQWFRRRGWELPRRCPACRKQRQAGRMTGVIVYYNDTNGYGYIRPDAQTGLSKDVKFDRQTLAAGMRARRQMPVVFTLAATNSPKHFRAEQVHPASGRGR